MVSTAVAAVTQTTNDHNVASAILQDEASLLSTGTAKSRLSSTRYWRCAARAFPTPACCALASSASIA